MSTYTVRWEEDVEADSPYEAAVKAGRMLRDRLADEPTVEVTDELGNVDAFDLHDGYRQIIRRIPEHKHDFVGDEDTCVVYKGCPVTWGGSRGQQ